MENASKALIIAGSVLISIMVISLGVFLFTNFSDTGKVIYDENTKKTIAEFNTNFTKYENSTEVTAQDIVTIANLARDNNVHYQVSKGDSSYITVLFKNDPMEIKSIKELNNFIQNNAYNSNGTSLKYYTCNSIEIDKNTRRVKKVTFN